MYIPNENNTDTSKLLPPTYEFPKQTYTRQGKAIETMRTIQLEKRKRNYEEEMLVDQDISKRKANEDEFSFDNYTKPCLCIAFLRHGYCNGHTLRPYYCTGKKVREPDEAGKNSAMFHNHKRYNSGTYETIPATYNNYNLGTYTI